MRLTMRLTIAAAALALAGDGCARVFDDHENHAFRFRVRKPLLVQRKRELLPCAK